MALLDSRILKQYNCCKCKISGVRLYRVIFHSEMYCKNCALLTHPDKTLLQPNEAAQLSDWCVAIPKDYDGANPIIECHGYSSAPISKVDWWKSLPDYSQRKLKDTLRRWRNV